jgi:hypothetical protein
MTASSHQVLMEVVLGIVRACSLRCGSQNEILFCGPRSWPMKINDERNFPGLLPLLEVAPRNRERGSEIHALRFSTLSSCSDFPMCGWGSAEIGTDESYGRDFRRSIGAQQQTAHRARR